MASGQVNIYEKLQRIQQKLKAPKSQYNIFGKYYYRNCEDIQEAVKPLLEEVGVVLTISDDIVMVGDRFYVKATAAITDCDTGSSISNTAYAREDTEIKGMQVSQITGSASSYARKYALNGLLCIDDNKDADTNNKINEEQYSNIVEELRRTGIGLKNILSNYGLQTLQDMSKGQYDDAIKILKAKADKDKLPPPVSDNEMKRLEPPEDNNGFPFN